MLPNVEDEGDYVPIKPLFSEDDGGGSTSFSFIEDIEGRD